MIRGILWWWQLRGVLQHGSSESGLLLAGSLHNLLIFDSMVMQMIDYDEDKNIKWPWFNLCWTTANVLSGAWHTLTYWSIQWQEYHGQACDGGWKYWYKIAGWHWWLLRPSPWRINQPQWRCYSLHNQYQAGGQGNVYDGLSDWHFKMLQNPALG